MATNIYLRDDNYSAVFGTYHYDRDLSVGHTSLRPTRLSQLRHSYRSERYSRLSIWNRLEDSDLDLSILTYEDLKAESTPPPIEESQSPKVIVDYCHWVKTLSLLCLVSAIILSLTFLGIGAALIYNPRPHPPRWLRGTLAIIGLETKSYYLPSWFYIPGHVAVPVPGTVQTLVPLMLSYALTAIIDVLSKTHSTTQRWSLWKERRLEFHSNLRLLSASKTYFPNRWYSNILFIVAICFSYGTLATLTSDVLVLGYDDGHANVSDKPYNGPNYGLDFSGWAILVLGMCLITQASISACCLFYDPGIVKSWSQSAIMTARASVYHQNDRLALETCESMKSKPRQWLCFVNLRCAISARLGSKSRPLPTPDQQGPTVASVIQPYLAQENAQPSAREMIPSIRLITIMLWVFTAALVIATTTIAIIAHRRNYETASNVQAWLMPLNVEGFWEWFGTIWFRYADPNSYLIGRSVNYDGATIALQSLLQAPNTLVLHYSGLLFDVIGDELLWRQAASKKGAKVNPGIVDSSLQNWPGSLLFLFKGLAQWIYGSVLHVDSVVAVALLPMATLSLLFVLLSTFAEVLSRWRPKGEQPATFGNLVLLAKYMDDLEGETLFWRSEGVAPFIPSVAPI